MESRRVEAMRCTLLIAVGLLASALAHAGDRPFVHPGLLHTQADLDRMRQCVAAGKEPWKGGFEKLRLDPPSRPDWKLRGPFEVVTRGSDLSRGNPQMVLDGNAAYQNALMWCVTGNEAHAHKAVEILNAWALKLRKMDGRDVQLSAGLNGFKFVSAAELMRHTYPAWPREAVARFERMLKEAMLPPIKEFAPFANGNWDAACLVTMMATGVFCDDRELFNRATTYFRSGQGNGRLVHYVFNETGQCQESGRDQQHTQLGLGLLAEACEIAWHQGVDLYAEADKYAKLTEDEIKSLVVDDKWLATIAAAVQGELDRVSQTLTGRIRQLAERYASPLPQLTGEVATLAARVDGHLKKMGCQV